MIRRTFARARLPLMVAPMFLVSSAELVIASQRAGVVGAFAAANARNIEALDDAFGRITAAKDSDSSVPWALNMIVHSSYDRFDAELELVKRYQPGIVSTALGSPKRVMEHVHAYGGAVIADVITVSMARKAIDAGVDALILVTHGAGGHTGTLHPFAFIKEVRRFWSGPIGLAGAIGTGSDIRVAQLLGADFVVCGTRFIATHESMASADYREMVVASTVEDLVPSKAVSGVMANWLKPTLEKAGLDDTKVREEKRIDFSGDIIDAPKAWKDVWSAGQGLGVVDCIAHVEEVVRQMDAEYLDCLREEQQDVATCLQKHEEQMSLHPISK